MDNLGRFYTKDIISNLLINNLKTISPKKILDLGIGDGSLTLAANNKWNNTKYYATEIEAHKIKEIENKFSFIKVYNYDSLHPTLSTRLKIEIGSIDVAICNPPYIRINDVANYSKLFEEINCNNFNKLKKITSEIVFFAQNIALLKHNGELGIIVSDSLITGKDYFYFRKTILENFDLRCVIQLPDKIFSKTEARTHILILSTSVPSLNTCMLYQSDISGQLSNGLKISKALLRNRMDYQYYSLFGSKRNMSVKLKDIGAEIIRGNTTYKELKENRVLYFHSNKFKGNIDEISFDKLVNSNVNYIVAKEGNILLCRVGKRCVGRLAFIKKGEIIISDCIYRIKVPKKYEIVVWKSFISEAGQIWLKAHPHGVCSLVISKCDLENFPLYALKNNKIL